MFIHQIATALKNHWNISILDKIRYYCAHIIYFQPKVLYFFRDAVTVGNKFASNRFLNDTNFLRSLGYLLAFYAEDFIMNSLFRKPSFSVLLGPMNKMFPSTKHFPPFALPRPL